MKRFGFALAAILGAGAVQLAAKPPSDHLEPGSARRRELAPGEMHRLSIRMDAGTYLHVAVEQIGIDVAVTVIDPEGRAVASMDTPTGDRGFEEVSWVARHGGEHLIAIESTDPAALPGAYVVRTDSLRAGLPADATRIRAEALCAEGHALAASGEAATVRQGLERLGSALSLWREVGDRRGEAMTLYGAGRACQLLRDPTEAIRNYTEALAIWRDIGDDNEAASTLFGLASTEFGMGRSEEALGHFQESLALQRQLGNPVMEAEVLASLGALYDILGEKQKAREAHLAALPLMRSTRNRIGEMRTLNDIGHLSDYQGEEEEALEVYREALELSRQLKQEPGEAMLLINLGRLYAELGEREQAAAHLREAQAIRRRLGDPGGEATVLLNLGKLAADQGDHARALELYQGALALFERSQNVRKQGSAVNAMGEIYLVQSRAPVALGCFDEALRISRDAGDRYLEGKALTNRGVALADLGEPATSREELARAVALRRSTGDRPGEATALFALARLERAQDDLPEARRQIELAMALLETQRVAAGSPELRASYLSTVREPYEFAVDLYMELEGRNPSEGFAALALETSERSRARGFLDLLTEARIDRFEGVDPDLRERARELDLRLQGQLERQLRLSGEGAPEEASRRVAQEILATSAQREALESRIRSQNPRYAALTRPKPLSVAQIRSELLDDETILLEYGLGRERSYLWVVGSSFLRSYTLPGREEIESAARRLYTLAASPAGRSAAPGMRAQAQALSRMLLAPAAAELSNKRLGIVADGALQYLPFAALPKPNTDVPLLVDHEIVSLPSASSLAVLREQTLRRPPAKKTIAVFADPVFDRDDPRLRPSSKPASHRAARGPEAPELPRLLFSRREARAILDLVPASQRLEAMDFDADRATATDPGLADYRFVHFATHGFFNTQRPELSGIVLSLVDREGHPRDGYLTARDVFRLNLSAEVVVLSACRTALGREIQGEGLVGITRGFLHAGSRRVVASLWRVDDVATSELMKRFYGEMLHAPNRSPAAALRSAQVALWKTTRWKDPYYWAAFLIQGEWN